MELFELDINALSKGKKEAFHIVQKILRCFVPLRSEIFHWEGGSRRYCTRNIL